MSSSKTCFSITAAGAVVLASAVCPASAQGILTTPGIPTPPSAVATPTSMVGIRAVPPPPATFSPLTASTAANAQYAVPPAPDGKSSPLAYKKWQRAIAGLQNRRVAIMFPTNVANGPKQPVGSMTKLANNLVTGTSSNWSGASVVNGTISTLEAIIGEYVVPSAHQAFGACTGGWDYSSQWPGIDGNGSNDVLQAGTEVDAYCNGGQLYSFYSAWVEWYPNYETRVSAPAVNPGDLMFVEVWSTSPTTGYVYLFNNSTQESAEYAMSAPNGTRLQGSSVEWITERPGVNGGMATLTNYIDSAWPYGVAWNYAAASPTYYFESTTPPVGTMEYLTMVDDLGQGISAASVENRDFLYFNNFGSSY